MSISKLPPHLHADAAAAHETAAWLSGKRHSLASELLFHYLYGKGSTMELNYEQLLVYTPMQNAHHQLQSRIRDAVQLKAISMRNDTMLSLNTADISPPHKEGSGLPYSFVESYDFIWPSAKALDHDSLAKSLSLAGAVGTAHISADPQIIITKQRGHIKLSGTVNYQFHDYYDFDLLKPEINADTWSKIKIGGENAFRQAFDFIASALASENAITFADLDNLQNAGLAANFKITSNILTELAEDYF